MPRLVYRTAALRDLANIAAHIERESQSRTVAGAFIDKIVEFCERLASLPGLMGRDRLSFVPVIAVSSMATMSSFYVMRMKASPRNHLYVMNVIHGAWDIDAFLEAHLEDDEVVEEPHENDEEQA